MSEHNQVFLHFIKQDLPIAQSISEHLRAEGITCFMLPEIEDVEAHFKVLQALEGIIAAGGALVLVVTSESLKSNLLIANAQYACELAGRRTVLVIYQAGDIPEQNPLALYYAQAAVIHAGSAPQRSLVKLVNHVKRVLARSDAPQALRPRRMPRKLVKRLGIGTAVLGVLLGAGNFFVPRILQQRQALPQIIATPVVFEQPFSGESLERGIISDRRFVPQPAASGDPQQEAPFYFAPAYIHKRLSFDDEIFENVNVLDDGRDSGAITAQDQLIIHQTSGMLQVAAAPQDANTQKNTGLGFGRSINYVISSGSMEYLGLRFRLDDYRGWSDASQALSLNLGLFSPQSFIGLADFNLQSRSIFTSSDGQQADHFLDADWHTLEFTPDPSSRRLNIHLDGERIGQTDPLPTTDQWMRLSFWMDVRATSDWLNFYLDEVVFGGSQPPTAASQAQDASFKFTPDEVLFQSALDGPFPEEVIVEEGLAFPISNGVFRFDIPSRAESHSTVIRIPAQPVERMNYYAMRYRITDQQPEFWSTWGYIGIKFNSPALERDQGSTIGVEASRYGAEYSYFAGRNLIDGARGSDENFQRGYWHTMEMLIIPVSGQEGRYLLQYWHDGNLVGENEIEPIEYFLASAEPFWVKFEAYAGQDRRQAFTGEFDEIIMGYIDFSGQQ